MPSLIESCYIVQLTSLGGLLLSEGKQSGLGMGVLGGVAGGEAAVGEKTKNKKREKNPTEWSLHSLTAN